MRVRRLLLLRRDPTPREIGYGLRVEAAPTKLVAVHEAPPSLTGGFTGGSFALLRPRRPRRARDRGQRPRASRFEVPFNVVLAGPPTSPITGTRSGRDSRLRPHCRCFQNATGPAPVAGEVTRTRPPRCDGVNRAGSARLGAAIAFAAQRGLGRALQPPIDTMKKNSTFASLTRTVGTLQALPLAAAAASNLFARRSRRRGRSTASSAYLVAGGVLAGAAAALLLNPWNGSDLRSRVGKLFGGGIGKLVGAQVGAHPVGTAKAVRKTQDLLGAHD